MKIEAQDSRNIGDYGTGPGLTLAQAATQLSRGEEFLRLVEGMLGSD